MWSHLFYFIRGFPMNEKLQRIFDCFQPLPEASTWKDDNSVFVEFDRILRWSLNENGELVLSVYNSGQFDD